MTNTFYQKKIIKYGMPKRREINIIGLLAENLTGMLVLDAGCATGYFGQKLGKKGAKIFGLDISESAIYKATKVLDDAKIIDLNKDKIPFENNTFDIIIASEIIEHLSEPKFALKEFNRVLKKTGDLILTTPNFLYWGNRLKFLKGQFRYTDDGIFDRTHIHFYTYETLLNDLLEAGFKITKENHILVGYNPFNIKSKFPALFAYQFVVKCSKNNSNF